MSPLGALGAGLVAGIGGTLAMTVYQEAVGRLRGGGGGGDPAPAQVGKRVLEGVFRRDVADKHLPLGLRDRLGRGLRPLPRHLRGVLGLGRPRLRRRRLARPVRRPPGDGAVRAIWACGPTTLAVDLSYHLVYGPGAAITFATLAT